MEKINKDEYDILYDTDITYYDVNFIKFNSIEDLLLYFNKNSYTNMVSINMTLLIGYFKINYENVYEKNFDIKKYTIKNINFITLKKKFLIKKNAILIPTYIGHKKYFINLINSIIYNVCSEYSINIIFSNIDECKQIMDDVPRIFYEKMHIYIYNVEYKGINKFNYQTKKKFFGLYIIPYEYCMIIDSDYLFKKTNLDDDINKYKNIIFKNKYTIVLDKNILFNTNKLLNSNYDFFPLENPWIYEKNKFIDMYKYFISININIIDFDFDYNIFEIILYRLYCIKYYTNDYVLIDINFDRFLFDSIENHDYKYSISNKLALKNNTTDNIKLILHLDR